MPGLNRRRPFIRCILTVNMLALEKPVALCHGFAYQLLPILCKLTVRISLFAAVRNGHIKRLTDQDIQSSVLEVMSTNVCTTYITCPADPNKTLGIKLPFLVMIIKNLKKYFSFEVQVLDDKNVRRRFRASNYQVRAALRR